MAVRRKPNVKLSRLGPQLGDFLERSPELLAAGAVDVMVTSPPYNIGINYKSYADNLSRADYLEWTALWAAEAHRVLSDEGSLFLNVGVRPSEPWAAWDVASVFREHFHLQNVIHWIKSISIAKQDAGNYEGLTKDITVGHYKPINSKRFLNDAQEYIFHFTKSGNVPLDRLAVGVPYQDPSNIKRWSAANGGLHCRGNVWFIPYPTIKFRSTDRPHPATFPVRLPEMCIRLHGTDLIRKNKGLVMDPFLGLGSSGVAAKRLGLDFVGFEVEPEYLEFAKRRIAETADAKKPKSNKNKTARKPKGSPQGAPK